MTMRGMISEGVPADIVRELHVARRTGVLSFTGVEHGPDGPTAARRVLQIVDGKIVTADSSLDADASAAAADADGEGQGERTLLLLARRILAGVLPWTDGVYAFREDLATGNLPGRSGTSPGPSKVLDLGRVAAEAAGTLSDPAAGRSLGGAARVARFTGRPLTSHGPITPAEADILCRIDGCRSTQDLLAGADMTRVEVRRALLALVCTGVVELTPPPVVPDAAAVRKSAAEPRPTVGPRSPVPPAPVVERPA